MDAPVNSPQPDILVRAKSIAFEAYDKTAKVTKETIQKIDQKYHDPAFQQDLQGFKEKVADKSRDFANTTIIYSNKAYFGLKSGMTSMFEFVKKKVNSNKENNQPEQATSLREELLKPDDQPPQ